MCDCRYSFLVLNLLCFAAATLFEGTCPNVDSIGPMNVDFEYGYVIYYTEVHSKINHLFYNSVPNLHQFQFMVKRWKTCWEVRKMNNRQQQCPLEFLVPSEGDFGYFVHGISKGSTIMTYGCGSFWDRYKLLQRGEIVALWGCVNLKSGHEEGLWLIVLERNKTYTENLLQVEADALALLPVGNITRRHLEKNTLKLETSDMVPPFDCSQLECKKNTKDHLFLQNLSFAITFVFCVVLSGLILVKGYEIFREFWNSDE